MSYEDSVRILKRFVLLCLRVIEVVHYYELALVINIRNKYTVVARVNYVQTLCFTVNEQILRLLEFVDNFFCRNLFACLLGYFFKLSFAVISLAHAEIETGNNTVNNITGLRRNGIAPPVVVITFIRLIGKRRAAQHGNRHNSRNG